MSRMSSARRLVMELRARARAGHYSLVWAALPCTPWSSWQHYNVRMMSDDAFQRLEKARVESIKMLQTLWFVVRSVQVEDGAHALCVRVATVVVWMGSERR
eukprot:4553831-Heterocapsa_arctica.AAC.1